MVYKILIHFLLLYGEVKVSKGEYYTCMGLLIKYIDYVSSM